VSYSAAFCRFKIKIGLDLSKNSKGLTYLFHANSTDLKSVGSA